MPTFPPYPPLETDEYLGDYGITIEAGLASPTAVGIDVAAADAFIALLAAATGVPAGKFTATYTTALDPGGAAAYAAAADIAALVSPPPSPPALDVHGCPLDGSMDICDVWPDNHDATFYGLGKYNYLYDDEKGTYGRIGAGGSLFGADAFVNNGFCEDGSPSLIGKPSRQYRLYLYPGVITSYGANPRSFGTAALEGAIVQPYYPCAHGTFSNDSNPFLSSPAHALPAPNLTHSHYNLALCGAKF